MKKITTAMAVVAAATLTAFAAGAAETITAMDHQKAVNRAICEKLVTCKPGKTVDQCAADFNKMSAMNPSLNTRMYSAAKSQACVTSLKGAGMTCDNALDKSVSGPCADDMLK